MADNPNMFQDYSLQEMSENDSKIEQSGEFQNNELNTTGEFFNQHDKTLPLQFDEFEIESPEV